MKRIIMFSLMLLVFLGLVLLVSQRAVTVTKDEVLILFTFSAVQVGEGVKLKVVTQIKSDSENFTIVEKPQTVEGVLNRENFMQLKVPIILTEKRGNLIWKLIFSKARIGYYIERA